MAFVCVVLSIYKANQITWWSLSVSCVAGFGAWSAVGVCTGGCRVLSWDELCPDIFSST